VPSAGGELGGGGLLSAGAGAGGGFVPPTVTTTVPPPVGAPAPVEGVDGSIPVGEWEFTSEPSPFGPPAADWPSASVPASAGFAGVAAVESDSAGAGSAAAGAAAASGASTGAATAAAWSACASAEPL